MQPFQKILVYAKEAGPALRRAARIAKATGGTIKLADVMEDPPSWIRALNPAKSRLPRLIAQDSKDHLEELAGPLREQGLRVDTKALHGKVPSLEITREVLKYGHDLVIKSAETKPGSRFFENSDVQLLRKCPCPVWLVRPRRTGRHAGIVAAIAPAPNDSAVNIPNTEIMEMAVALSQLQGGDLHVIRAWRAYGEGALRRKAQIQRPDLRDYLSATRQKLNAVLKGFLVKYGEHVHRRRVHLLKGHPGVVIPNFAKTRPIDVIVMGAGPRKGVADILIGSTTERIITQVDCCVFAVKPEGFVSPVQSE